MTSNAHRAITMMNSGMLAFLTVRDVGVAGKASANLLFVSFLAAFLMLFADAIAKPLDSALRSVGVIDDE